MCIAESKITNDNWQRYTGFAHIGTLDVPVVTKRSSWWHTAYGGVCDEPGVSCQTSGNENKNEVTVLMTSATGWLLVERSPSTRLSS